MTKKVVYILIKKFQLTFFAEETFFSSFPVLFLVPSLAPAPSHAVLAHVPVLSPSPALATACLAWSGLNGPCCVT